MPAEPIWLTIEQIYQINADQLQNYGGLPGVASEHLVESAVANPQNLFYYEGEDDLLVLAIRLGISIARNHGFNDGNKRTGTAALFAFLIINGFDLRMPDDTLLGRMLEAVITHDMTEEEFADHLDPYLTLIE